MRKQKQIFLDYIKEVKNLLGDNFVSIENLSKMEKEIKDKELIIPIVGGFSAGKTTLINSFLNAEILPTNLTPETALATELRYGKNDYIEAVKSDGSCDKYKLSQQKEIKESASKYQFLKVYLNNEKLKEIEPLILVDMPGFDSPLELHNKAILNYLAKGVYFITLVSVEDGVITKTILRELENIAGFGKEFSLCLSKTNLKVEEDVSEIKETIQEQLNDELDFEKDVVLVDDDGGKNLEIILKDINSEKLFYSLFIDRLKDNYFYLESEINTKIYTLKKSKEESLETINSLKDAINKIISKKEELISQTKSRYSNKSSEAIINAVATELSRNQEQLVSMIMQNQELFKNEINALVKNRLISELNSRITTMSGEIIADFSFELKSLNVDNFVIDDKWLEIISNGTANLIKSTQSGLDKMVQYTNGKEGKIYKVITTTLGITTTILNPILEVVLIFLPDIITLFTSKAREKKQKEMLKQKFNAEVIPSLKVKLREVVQTIMQEQITKLVNEISIQFETKIKEKEKEVKLALQEKEKTIEENKKEIKRLEDLKVEIQRITTENLIEKD